MTTACNAFARRSKNSIDNYEFSEHIAEVHAVLSRDPEVSRRKPEAFDQSRPSSSRLYPTFMRGRQALSLQGILRIDMSAIPSLELEHSVSDSNLHLSTIPWNYSHKSHFNSTSRSPVFEFRGQRHMLQSDHRQLLDSNVVCRHPDRRPSAHAKQAAGNGSWRLHIRRPVKTIRARPQLMRGESWFSERLCGTPFVQLHRLRRFKGPACAKFSSFCC
jgi:hypothetical protein